MLNTLNSTILKIITITKMIIMLLLHMHDWVIALAFVIDCCKFCRLHYLASRFIEMKCFCV